MNTKPLWLYRILEVDDDGDPLDHGVARASDAKELMGFLAKHLTAIVGEGVELTVRVYPLYDTAAGVLTSPSSFDVKFGTR